MRDIGDLDSALIKVHFLYYILCRSNSSGGSMPLRFLIMSVTATTMLMVAAAAIPAVYMSFLLIMFGLKMAV
jgi:hypothetical protein